MKFKVPFVKNMYVRGYKVFEGETREDAVNQAQIRIHDTENPLMTSEVTWGNPQYEEDSFEMEVGDGTPEDIEMFVKPYDEHPPLRMLGGQFYLEIGEVRGVSEILPAECPDETRTITAVRDERHIGDHGRCQDCAVVNSTLDFRSTLCSRLVCQRTFRPDAAGVRFEASK